MPCADSVMKKYYPRSRVFLEGGGEATSPSPYKPPPANFAYVKATDLCPPSVLKVKDSPRGTQATQFRDKFLKSVGQLNVATFLEILQNLIY